MPSVWVICVFADGLPYAMLRCSVQEPLYYAGWLKDHDLSSPVHASRIDMAFTNDIQRSLGHGEKTTITATETSTYTRPWLVATRARVLD
jgi:hypothetical protein